MEYIEFIDPEIIYFTHSKIRSVFSGCNKTINETIEEIRSNKIQPSSLPYITVYYDGNNYYSQNNRRLWVFKYCKQYGLLKDNVIPVRVRKMGKNKYSTLTCSLNAKICLK